MEIIVFTFLVVDLEFALCKVSWQAVAPLLFYFLKVQLIWLPLFSLPHHNFPIL